MKPIYYIIYILVLVGLIIKFYPDTPDPLQELIAYRNDATAQYTLHSTQYETLIKQASQELRQTQVLSGAIATTDKRINALSKTQQTLDRVIGSGVLSNLPLLSNN